MKAAIGLIALASCFISPPPAVSKNYEQVICDDEPDPGVCKTIQQWYAQAKMPKSITYAQNGVDNPVSCCGLGDAYWVDQLDKIVPQGIYVTVTDDRKIQNRRDANGVKLFIPNGRIDDRYQGNPTGHAVVFMAPQNISYYADIEGEWPTIYCYFPDVGI